MIILGKKEVSKKYMSKIKNKEKSIFEPTWFVKGKESTRAEFIKEFGMESYLVIMEESKLLD